MGYYARGSGSIRFRRYLTQEDRDAVGGLLDDAWFEHEFFGPCSTEAAVTGADIWFDGKYRDDDVTTLLERILTYAPVEEGAVEFSGEDGEFWRYLYDTEKNHWRYQYGFITWTDPKSPSSEAYNGS